MSQRDILCWPDPRLSQPCAPVEEITADIEKLAADMLETMYAAPGRGLAAPQVGQMLRLFVMDADWKEGTPTPQVFVDPEITWRSDEISCRAEGCLSLPGVLADVRRPDQVRLRWRSLDGGVQEQTFDGFAAACVQHEMDHLNGVVTLDHLEADERARVLKAYSAVLA